MGKGDGIISIMPLSTKVADSTGRDAYLKAKLADFKDKNTGFEYTILLQQYENDIKAGNFQNISQTKPEFYEALLNAGIAPREGVDYNNYQNRVSLFSAESNKRPTPKTPTEHKQNSLTETIMDGYKSLQKSCKQINILY